jgi:hypothetical protein
MTSKVKGIVSFQGAWTHSAYAEGLEEWMTDITLYPSPQRRLGSQAPWRPVS